MGVFQIFKGPNHARASSSRRELHQHLFGNLLWIMIAIWAWKGFIAALLLGASVYQAIKWLDLRLARSRY